MQFIPYCLKKILRDFSILVVVHTALLIYIGYFQLETPFACPDFPDAHEEFVEVVFAKAFALF
jgi:hypothetical protein